MSNYQPCPKARRAVAMTILLASASCGKSGEKVDEIFAAAEVVAPSRCQQENVKCASLTPAEQARIALDDREYATAEALYAKAIKEANADPAGQNLLDYNWYALQAAAIAGQANFDLQVALAQLSSLNGDQGLLEQTALFVPSIKGQTEEAYQVAVGNMLRAFDTLGSVPSSEVSSSVRIQKLLYGTSFTVMQLNLLTINASSGLFDPSKAAEMTDEQAIAILHTIGRLAADQLSDEQAGLLQVGLEGALTQIEEGSGSTTKEKLLDFLGAQ